MESYTTHILSQLKEGILSIEEAEEKLKGFTDYGFAKVDDAREFRQGFPEVIFGANKTEAQIVEIFNHLVNQKQTVLATRVTTVAAEAVCSLIPATKYDEAGRTLLYKPDTYSIRDGKKKIGVICAGTSDIPVAREAEVTIEAMGHLFQGFYDIGVAGIHRLFAQMEEINKCQILVVIAGMEGALPSVVGGLVSVPVIAVPTSVGYGANLNGVAALLSMLNTCASGVTVVNIDNGFGAGYAASLMLRV
ncbi:nickel pincer cofactor biosynthesis protein LarB [Bacillus sp. CECT 9360]|uniref:nickel pincer cofactor biosynthesis protein LarB n=1 Tax=Bacillus sp. CECT 9360 TaxID=2845821 RepID=UPI001E2AAAAC|nr:nickel pincer cofactor biosynthesis protein LarB [Bacillus sp. CECT 9360]CAH0343848.1 Pyridinium-3,5-biscarboxylic acid mononucleotide synthase [Bacillus sp. CECT 9360]